MIRKVFLTGLMALSIGALDVSAQNETRIADKQYELKAFDEALASYLLGDQSDFLIQDKIAKCYQALGNDLASVEWYSKIDRSEWSKIALDYGRALKRLGKYELAKEIFASANSNEGHHEMASCDKALLIMEASYKEVYPAAFNTKKADFGVSFVQNQPVFCSFAENLSFINPVQRAEGNRLYSTEASEVLNENRVYNLRPAIKANYSLGPISYGPGLIAYTKNGFKSNVRLMSGNTSESAIYLAKPSLGGDFENEYAFPFNESGYGSAFPFITEDGQTLIYASNKPGGYGGFDLYESTLINGEWTLPTNLGPEINSVGNEITPSLSDGVLMFASDFHMGLGGFDIFESDRDGQVWTTPLNMGHGINSPEDDYFPARLADVDRLYFTSNRIGGRGLDDIYVSEKLTEEALPPPVFVLGNMHRESKQESVLADNSDVLMVSDKEVIERTIISESTNELNSEVSNKVANLHVPLNYTNQDFTEESTLATPASRSLLDAIEHIENVKTTTSTSSRVYDLPEIKHVSKSSALLVDMDFTTARRSFEGADVPPVSSVYFVQLAAFNRSSADLDAFEKLVQFGNIYKVHLNTAIKVRLGYFTSEDEARVILRKVKAEGYRDAFVTYQPLDITNLELVYSNYDYTSSSSTNTTTTQTYEDTPSSSYEPSSYMPKSNFSGTSNYKIRLASYEDASSFDIKSAKGLGHIEQWTKGGWTIFILSGYKNLDEAEAGRRRAVNKGFSDAEVVLDNDGILERLKQN